MRFVGRIHKFSPGANRGYMPQDLPQHRPPRRIKPWWKVLGKPRVSIPAFKPIEGFSDQPEYPPLEYLGRRNERKLQRRIDWYNQVKNIPTVEEKMYEMSRHARHYMANIHSFLIPYNSLPTAQYITQTNVINSLPNQYDSASAIDDALVDRVKKLVLQQIAIDSFESVKGRPRFVSKSVRNPNRRQFVSDRFVQNVINSVTRAMSLDNDQLDYYQKDLSPAIRSWWYHSGLEPPNNKVFYNSRKDEDGCINQMIQLDAAASLAYRSDNSIEPLVPLTDPIVTDTSLVPRIKGNLKDIGAEYKFKWPVSVPGCWYNTSSAKYDFPHTCFLTADCLDLRTKKSGKPLPVEPDDRENCLITQSILSAYTWSNSLALLQGFTTFQELEYPLTCQTITTNGREWLFTIYQLNSHAFHRDLAHTRVNNVCWTSGLMKLYDEYSDGQFHGVNDDVIRLLTRFFQTRVSEEYTSKLNLRPYLGEDTRSEEDQTMQATEMKKFLTNKYDRWLASQYQKPLFEHIYFRSPANRNRITFMKAQWHIPTPKYPDMFE